MKIAMSMILIVGLSACGGGGTSPSINNSPTNSGSGSVPVANNTTLATLLNDVRAANGAKAVTFNATLAKAAQIHADDMLKNNFFAHEGSDGSRVWDRATRVGYNWRHIGENLGKGQKDEAQVMDGWTASPRHHANNINPDFEEFALATSGSGWDRYWVLVLGTQK